MESRDPIYHSFKMYNNFHLILILNPWGRRPVEHRAVIKIRLEIFSVVFEFVCGEIKVGIRNLTLDTEFFITARCSMGLLPQGLSIRIKWKLLYILKDDKLDHDFPYTSDNLEIRI